MNENPDMQPVISPSPPSSPLKALLGNLPRKAKLLILLACIVVVLAAIGLLLMPSSKHTKNTANTSKATVTTTPANPIITTFDQCKAAPGSTLSQTTPQQCTTSKGQIFTAPTPAPATAPTTPKPASSTTSSSAPKTSTSTSSTSSQTSSSSGGQTASSGLFCQNPIYTTSWPQTQYGGWQDANGTHVNANVLTGAGGSNSQVLNICSATNWNVVANFTDNGGSINTYPDTEYDMSGDKTITQYSSMQTCFGSQEPTPAGPQWPTPGGSEWDYAYDVWINHHTGENVWSNDIEIMLWNDWTDNIYPPAVGNVSSGGSRAVTIDGIAYHMFQGGGANEWIYTRDVKASTGCFDMLNIMKDLVANESTAAGITSASVPEHVEYGVEIAGTVNTQTFQITNASLTVR